MLVPKCVWFKFLKVSVPICLDYFFFPTVRNIHLANKSVPELWLKWRRWLMIWTLSILKLRSLVQFTLKNRIFRGCSFVYHVEGQEPELKCCLSEWIFFYVPVLWESLDIIKMLFVFFQSCTYQTIIDSEFI